MKPFGQALLWLTLAGTLSGCGEQKENPSTAQAAAAPEKNSAVAAIEPPAEASAAELSVTAPLVVEHQVDVTAQRDGIVRKISVDTGTRVGASTVLARLDDRQLEANLEAARAKTRSIAADLKNWQAEAEVLEADYIRAQRLYAEKLIADEQLQHAKYKAESDRWDILRVTEQLNTAKQEEHSLELELEKTRVMAPFGGLVARRYVREGQSVAKGDRLFWVTEEGPLRVRFTLPERFISRVKRGQLMALTAPDLAGEKHAVEVVEMSPVVDPSSGTIEVLAELVGARGELRPGMTVAVRVPDPQ